MEKWRKKGQILIDEIENTMLCEGETALWYLGQMGFMLKTSNNDVILIDPVLNDITDENGKSVRLYEAPFLGKDIKADYVLCTHGHIDHMACETLVGIKEANPAVKILLPSGVKKISDENGLSFNSVYIRPGESIELDEEISVLAISAAHPVHIYDDNNENMALSYIILLNSQTFVHLGDTYLTDDLLASLDKHRGADVFIAPINGDDLFRKNNNMIGNMSAEETAALAVLLNAGLAIPGHYDMIMGNTVDPLRFIRELRNLNPRAAYSLPALGERIIIKK